MNPVRCVLLSYITPSDVTSFELSISASGTRVFCLIFGKPNIGARFHYERWRQ